MRMRRSGFSVLERLVVVAIILATIAIVIPDLLRSKMARSVGPEFNQRSLRGEGK
jgi:type II secretory pathway pseudopilin PulG